MKSLTKPIRHRVPDAPLFEIGINTRLREKGGDNSGNRAAIYCTVDDVTSTDPWNTGTGAVHLAIDGKDVTVFDRICTHFREDWAWDEHEVRKYLIEAHTKSIDQFMSFEHRGVPFDVKFFSTLFVIGTPRPINGVWIGTEIYRSPEIVFDRRCSATVVHNYTFKSPGLLAHADRQLSSQACRSDRPDDLPTPPVHEVPVCEEAQAKQTVKFAT